MTAFQPYRIGDRVTVSYWMPHGDVIADATVASVHSHRRGGWVVTARLPSGQEIDTYVTADGCSAYLRPTAS